jgi:hypothetical protein
MEVYAGRIAEMVRGEGVSILSSGRIQRATKESVMRQEWKKGDRLLLLGVIKKVACPLFYFFCFFVLGGSIECYRK